MQRIVLNLLSNGIKYSDPGKASRWVKLSTRLLDKQVRIEIADNGLGIDAELLASGAIFKPFFQANNQHRESDKGVGLGLSIVQAMLALLPEHQLSARSQVGVGTTMTLDVPRASAGQAATGRWSLLRKPLSSAQLLVAIHEAIGARRGQADLPG